MGPGDKPPEKEDSVDFTILDVMITIRSMSACDAQAGMIFIHPDYPVDLVKNGNSYTIKLSGQIVLTINS